VKRQLKVRSAADVADCIQEALAGWSRWALGVHWLVLAAEAVGLRGQGERNVRLAVLLWGGGCHSPSLVVGLWYTLCLSGSCRH
jgi:hypothetical protein